MYKPDHRVIVIAGPNGAGKTTFAQEFLPREADCPIFVNADLIAAGLSPFEPRLAVLRAGRLMLEEITRHVTAGENFAFETTLAGRGYAHLIRQWQARSYKIKIIFLKLDHPETAIARVAERVRQGGHDVPQQIIHRRFHAGLENFNTIYAPLADSWVLYDNSGEVPVLIDWSSADE